MVSSAQIFVADAVMLFVRLFKGFTLTESLDLQPLASVMVTKYFVVLPGKTVGPDVLAKIILLFGVQLKVPMPVADNCTESNAQ